MINANSQFFDILETLPNLDNLHLCDCVLTGRTEHQLPLRVLSVSHEFEAEDHGRLSTSSSQLVSLSILEELFVLSHQGTSKLLPSLATAGVIHHLTIFNISLPADMQDHFFKFLHSCPSLKSLAVLQLPCYMATPYSAFR